MGVGAHILVVEPNDVTRKLIVGILNARGHATLEAPNGDGAMAFLGKSPGLVIVDVDDESPGTIGFLHKMRRDHSRLPMVAMSDREDREGLKNRLGMQNLSFLEKPVMPEQLMLNIESHLIAGVESNMAAPAPPQAASETVSQETRNGFMRRALDLAQETMDAGHGGPFGAVIVRNGKIIAEGRDTVPSDKDPTAHAEMSAIRIAAQAVGDYSLAGCEIYSSCEPCAMCLAALYWARIDRIFYAVTREDAGSAGFDTDFIFREVAQPEHKRTLHAKMMLHDEGRIILDNWMKISDKTGY